MKKRKTSAQSDNKRLELKIQYLQLNNKNNFDNKRKHLKIKT